MTTWGFNFDHCRQRYVPDSGIGLFGVIARPGGTLWPRSHSSSGTRRLARPLPRFEAIDPSRYDFIEVRSPLDVNQVQQLLYILDRGESEAIALALEVGAQLILMDEKGGRKIAEQHGIVPLGTLGVLVRAKFRSHIPAVRPLVEKLDELGFFMSAELRNNALRLAGE